MQTSLLELKKKNQLLNNLELLTGEASLSSIPPHLEIEFTNACNLRCYMCYQSSDSVDYAHIKTNVLNNIVGLLPYVKTILIAGLGEQLLSPSLTGFLKIAADYYCETTMFTNGQLINKNIDAFKYLSLAIVSFDGALKEVFETLRYGADFEKTLSNIRLLRSEYPELAIRLSCVVSKLNIDQIEDVVKLGYKLGVNIITFSYVQHSPRIELTKNDYLNLKNQYEKAMKFSFGKNICIHFGDFEYLNEFEEKDGIRRDDLLAEIKKECENRKRKIPKDIKGMKRIISSSNKIKEIKQITTEEIKEKIEILDNKIDAIEKMIRENAITKIKKPYCNAMWNYLFIRLNGNIRLCPYYHLEPGNLDSMNSDSGINDRRIVDIRESLVKRKNMLSVCESCPDICHREYNYSIFKEICEKYKIAVCDTQ